MLENYSNGLKYLVVQIGKDLNYEPLKPVRDGIVKKGSVLYFMGQQEYEDYFVTLPPRTQERLLADWDAFPGQGMVYRLNSEDLLVITGLEFGNIKIMVQPIGRAEWMKFIAAFFNQEQKAEIL